MPADGRALPVSGEHSAAVLAAQERLFELRRKLAAERGRLEEKGGKGEREKGSAATKGGAGHSLMPDPIAGPSALEHADSSSERRTAIPVVRRNDERQIQSAPPCSPAPLPSVAELAQHLAAGGALGWHSETLTRHLRAAAERNTRYEIRDTSAEPTAAVPHVGRDGILPAGCQTALHGPSALANAHSSFESGGKGEKEKGSTLSPLPPFPPAPLIRVYPDLALAMLRHKAAAAGRVWLLLRGLDATGKGRLSAADAARRLTTDDSPAGASPATGASPAHICGRRQFANLLRAGEGLYWQRDRGRDGVEYIRLHGAARVAAALGVQRLDGRPVAVPLAALTGTIGQARAQLYAAFHSGRTQTDFLTGARRARGPIARETLCKLSGASRNSQRAYERRAGVARRAAFALGPRLGAADEHEAAWRRGRALFHYRDAAGRYGRPGAVYLAWQLPNEYTGPHDTLSRGHQKRLNRDLADLFHNGMTGNGERDTRYEVRDTSEEGARKPVGQWVSGSVGQWSVEESAFSSAGKRAEIRNTKYEIRDTSSESALNSYPVSRNSYLRRRFYNSAKGAYLARHDGEKYWRQGQMWIITNYELGITNSESTTRSVDSTFVISNS